MKKKNKQILILTVLVCLSPIILGIVLYNKLPDQMPIHFTINDVPDNYANKNFALFGIPVIMAIVQLICLLVTMKANKLNDSEETRIIKIMEWFIPVVTVLIYIIMVEVPLGSTVYVGKSICLILGILFLMIGNYLPKISYEVGKTIFHPRLKTEQAFRKMSRAMGYSFVVMGMVFLVLIIWV